MTQLYTHSQVFIIRDEIFNLYLKGLELGISIVGIHNILVNTLKTQLTNFSARHSDSASPNQGLLVLLTNVKKTAEKRWLFLQFSACLPVLGTRHIFKIVALKGFPES